MTRIILGIAALIAWCSAALAQQTVTRIGPITLGDCASFQSPNSIQDGGIPCGVGHFANPTGAVGLTVVNGSAVTSMRSDAAPPLSASVQSALTQTVSQVLIGTGAFGFSSVVTVPIAQGGTGQATATLGFQALAPAPTRAGDVIYWNGSTWVTIAGNNSGTQILSENASGVPAWSAAGTGSVTSVTCGTGLSGGTFTTSGTCAVSLSVITNSLGANVALNNTGTYFDGPSVAQGTSGMWCATGTVTIQDTAASGFNLKLWDGTTVIASARTVVAAANAPFAIALSGCLNTPAGNIRISVNDSSATTGTMVFNASGNSKDGTITAWRVQ